MVEAGVLDETTRVELEDGVLVDMAPAGDDHDDGIEWSTGRLVRTAPEEFGVRVQSTFRIPDGGFYVPDVVVVPQAGAGVPRSALLVVEVAQTSLPRDREKAATYETAGVVEYSIVDLEAEAIHVHRRPEGARYADVSTARPGHALALPYEAPDLDIAALLRR